MLELGFPVDGTQAETPTHNAAHNGHLELVKLLLSRGANLHQRDHNHFATPLGWAQAGDRTNVTDYLETLEVGIFDLINIGDVERVRDFLNKHPNVIERPIREEDPGGLKEHDVGWQTPIVFAAIRDKIDLVKLFIESGADTRIRSPSGRPLSHFGNDEIKELLAQTTN